MTATMMTTNGRLARKSLAEQIDRLDQILDGLADALNEAVVTAVREAAYTAVQAAVAEVLTNAELQRRLHPAVEKGARPTTITTRVVQAVRQVGGWLMNKVTGAWSWATTMANTVCTKAVAVVGTGAERILEGTGQVCQRVKALLVAGWQRTLTLVYLVKLLRKPVLIALGIGLVVGVACYLAGPVAAAVVSGVHSALVTLAAVVMRPLARMWSSSQTWA